MRARNIVDDVVCAVQQAIYMHAKGCCFRQMQLILRILRSEREGFAESLVDALSGHIRWTADIFV